MAHKKYLYMLIGVPGSGKSTWIESQVWPKELPIVSTDRFIDEYAAQVGKTYNEVFKEYIGTATAMLKDQVATCRGNGTSIVWDQTNTSVKSRKEKLAMLPDYYKIAVFFKTPEAEEHARRLANRPGKSIPRNVMGSMIANLEMPTEAEGFREIWYAY